MKTQVRARKTRNREWRGIARWAALLFLFAAPVACDDKPAQPPATVNPPRPVPMASSGESAAFQALTAAVESHQTATEDDAQAVRQAARDYLRAHGEGDETAGLVHQHTQDAVGVLFQACSVLQDAELFLSDLRELEMQEGVSPYTRDLYRLAQFTMLAGTMRDPQRAYDYLLPRLEDTHHPQARLRFTEFVYRALVYWQREDEALDVLRRMRDLMATVGDAGAGKIVLLAMELKKTHEDWEGLLEWSDTFPERAPDRTTRFNWTVMRVEALSILGREEEAVQALTTALDQVQADPEDSAEDRQQQGWLDPVFALWSYNIQVRMQYKRLAAAREFVDRALERYPRGQERQHFLVLKGRVLIGIGDLDAIPALADDLRAVGADPDELIAYVTVRPGVPAPRWNLPRLAVQPPQTQTSPGSTAPPEPAAEEMVGLSSLRGRPVLQFFWMPDAAEHRQFLTDAILPLQAEHPELQVVTVALAWERPRVTDLSRTISRMGPAVAQVPHAFDRDNVAARAYHLVPKLIPWIVLVDANGNCLGGGTAVDAVQQIPRWLAAAEEESQTQPEHE